MGDTEQEAVERFLESVGVGERFADGQVGALVAEVRKAMAESRLRPALVLQYETPASGLVDFEFWHGDDVEARVVGFANAHGLDQAQAQEMADQVTELLQAKGLLPVLQEEVALPDGRRVPFALRHGEDIARAVDALLAEHGVGGEYAGSLLDHVREVGVARRVLPELSYAARVRGKPAELRLFRGDDLDDVLAEFGDKHRLEPEELEALGDALRKEAMARRLAPVARVPLPDAGEGVEFLLYDGDNLLESAREFIESRGLGDKLDARTLAKMAQGAHVGA